MMSWIIPAIWLQTACHNAASGVEMSRKYCPATHHPESFLCQRVLSAWAWEKKKSTEDIVYRISRGKELWVWHAVPWRYCSTEVASLGGLTCWRSAQAAELWWPAGLLLLVLAPRWSQIVQTSFWPCHAAMPAQNRMFQVIFKPWHRIHWCQPVLPLSLFRKSIPTNLQLFFETSSFGVVFALHCILYSAL